MSSRESKLPPSIPPGLESGHALASAEDFDSYMQQRAQDYYAVYCASSDGKNFRGDACPTWDALPPAVRGHWLAVARRAQHMMNAGWQESPITPPSAAVLATASSPAAALAVWARYMGWS